MFTKDYTDEEKERTRQCVLSGVETVWFGYKMVLPWIFVFIKGDIEV